MAKINDILPKATLCLQEILCVRDILSHKQADETCSRLLGTYVAMRLDDLTLLMEAYANQTGQEKDISDVLKRQYNEKFRKIRDKLGSHFQKTEGGSFEKVDILRSFNFKDIIGVVDDANTAYQLVTGLDEPDSIMGVGDITRVNSVLRDINMDGTAHLGNDILALGAINTGAMISLSVPQRRAQELRSIQLLVEICLSLCKPKYESHDLRNIFKRLLVAHVVNFWDNLVTRTDIKPDAEQYEEGFDILYKQLKTDNDNWDVVGNAFDDFYKRYPAFCTKMKQVRHIREHACAHLDRNSLLIDIQAELDSIDVETLRLYFDTMLTLFEYIVNNVFLLHMHCLQPRTPLYNSNFEQVHETDFYQRSAEIQSPRQMSVDEMFHAIYKNNADTPLALEQLKSIVGFWDSKRYYSEVLPKLVERFLEPTLSHEELCRWINFMHSCKNGFPARIIDFISVVLPDVIGCRLLAIMWLFSQMHIYEDDKVSRRIIDAVVNCDSYIVKAFALMAELNSHSNVSGPVNKDYDTDVDAVFKQHIESLKNPIEKLSVLIALGAHWYEGSNKGYIVSKKKKYGTYIDDEVKNAIFGYSKYIKLSQDDKYNLLELVDKHLFLYLNYYFSVIEKDRNQKQNKFVEAFKSNCFPRNGLIPIEEIYTALNYEEAGALDSAFNIMECVVKANPLNTEFYKCMLDLAKRHKELEQKLKELEDIEKLLGK